MDEKYIPLLSGKDFKDFSPEEFKIHVESLYHKRESRKVSKKEIKPFIIKQTKSGGLSIKVNRELSQGEIEDLLKKVESQIRESMPKSEDPQPPLAL